MRRIKEMEESMDERIDAKVKAILASRESGAPQDPIPTAFSPQFRGRSSCGSTPLGEEANGPHPLDAITEPINVRLYIHQQWTKDKVALGQAWPVGDGTINGRPIPPGYAPVTIDRIYDKKFNKIHIDYPAAED
jgi:hypothetical protein